MSTSTGKLKRGRPRKVRNKNPTFNLTIIKKDFPNIEALMLTKNRQELYDKYGIDLPRDLDWARSSIKGLSHRASVILEIIARGAIKQGGSSAENN